MSLHESAVLKPRDPSLTNSDDWPIFSLQSAFVYDPLGDISEPCNLLHAGAYKPLAISGKLQPLPAKARRLFLRSSPTHHQPIVVTDVLQFSYGQYEDGSVEVWAAGRAGWYTINPSRAYKDVYADITQAIKLLYFAADTYKEMKKLPTGLDVKSLFVQVGRGPLARRQSLLTCPVVLFSTPADLPNCP